MPSVVLTARKVLSLKPSTIRVDYWDANLKGFGLRVAPSGRKTWSVYYRFHGRKRRLSIGTFPKTSLAEARGRARKALSTVDGGTDPLAEKTQIQQAGTFGELADEYLERHAKREKKSWRNDQWMIERHLRPRWQHVKARDISRADVRGVVENIADSGAPVLANRVLALASKIFNFAIGRDWRNDNPCHGVGKNKETARDRVLNDDELKRIWNALEQEDPFCQALFRLRLLTAQRGGEIRHMRWIDVDLDRSEWVPARSGIAIVLERQPLVTNTRATDSTLRQQDFSARKESDTRASSRRQNRHEPFIEGAHRRPKSPFWLW